MAQARRKRRSLVVLLFPIWIAVLAACTHCAARRGDAPANDPALLDLSQNYYVVEASAGDTYFSLAWEHNVSPYDVLSLNQVHAPYRLQPGQMVRIPTPRVHMVRRGETLSGIAKKYHVDFYDLAQANALNAPFTIYPGQILRLPALRPVFKQQRATQVHASAEPEMMRRGAPGRHYRQTTRFKPRPKPRSLASRRLAAHGFIWPVRGPVISDFGPSPGGRRNNGINIAVPERTPVRAAADGVVIYRGNEAPGYGKLVLIRHAGNFITAYAHNSEILVGKGEHVRKGQPIALSGRTGNVLRPQLHFEVRHGVEAVDPRPHLRV